MATVELVIVYRGHPLVDIIIFGLGFSLHLQKWIYTVVTRATELNNVYLLTGKSQVMNDILLDTYLLNIYGYRQQYKAAKRLISNIIVLQWVG